MKFGDINKNLTLNLKEVGSTMKNTRSSRNAKYLIQYNRTIISVFYKKYFFD